MYNQFTLGFFILLVRDVCVFCLLRLPNSLLLRFADISHILLICDFDLPYQLSVLSVSLSVVLYVCNT